MLFQLNDRSNTPIWEQIVNQVKEMILKGIMQPNDKLLSVRELSSTLLVNPNTVSKAYQELERQGIIETRRGKGTFVSENIKKQIDDERIIVMKESLKQLIVEASYLDIDRDTLMDWVEDILDELGGTDHA
ncbi:GntR family transcriptional regulator [Lottiidibacillus patelloidae]|uniref:GntR family transcriptional regulator n=1 Tax=Lottiidibacillus patelloidae TaxID=2670334 RepID=A0A263BRE6_9BACI|nr:GntR family transcriptional regulator [Lottiidibacillus patelloidae]OZM56264.1 GntR family transcriptional regulator [Lottiidibacillus patelloidae]